MADHTQPSLNDIREAHARIAPHIHRTPVFTSTSLDEIAGAKLFFKCENLQKTGSFKIRGATNAILLLSDEEARHGVVTPSSGNHGAALSRAARSRGIQAYVVMPNNSPMVKRKAVEAYGGCITLCEPTMQGRQKTCAEVQARTGAILIHPYDDDRIIAGQGTAAKELLEDVPDLDFVIAPVSGGGLLSGTAIASKGIRPRIRVIGAEPKNADDAFEAMRAGKIVPCPPPDTIADGLRATLSPRTFAILQRHVDEISTVTEEEIVAAMLLLWERMKLVVEPSGAVSAAPALNRRINGAGKRIGIILSGGNVDLAALPFA
ncbi:MAG TPA: pyridoxal-phosphate dependent enzyme [Candidatus Acidoferrum sp.]|nr:pyridoxal-phosphate dependent enzyme [Candidatus Acidoferrum sp.]